MKLFVATRKKGSVVVHTKHYELPIPVGSPNVVVNIAIKKFCKAITKKGKKQNIIVTECRLI